MEVFVQQQVPYDNLGSNLNLKAQLEILNPNPNLDS